jgi:hypothetical protein
MFTRDELVQLYRRHRDERVLSVYLNADERDLSKRRAWRVELDHAIDAARPQVDERAADRAAFERALGHLEQPLSQFGPQLPERGWAGFATAAGLLYAESLPVAMPDLARWKDGPTVAPYVRVLTQGVPSVTVLADHRQAKLFRARAGVFEELLGLRAETDFGDLSDNVNMSKRAATHSGVRAESDTDAAQRIEREAVERLLKQVIEVVGVHAGNHGAIVVGGPPEITAATLHRLPKTMRERAIEDPTISFYTPVAELKRATEAAAAAVTARRQERLVEQVVEWAGGGGRACLGRKATDLSLVERRVEMLLLSRTLEQSDPDYAERCVDAAFEQDAIVEDLVGPGALHLDRDGQGIGARLRFTI